MQILILKPGLLSTIQDSGRQNYLSQAVPLSGSLDALSACIANKAVGNSDDAAVIEFTYADAEFIAETDLLIAYAGGGAVLTVEEQSLPRERPVFVLEGTVVTLKNEPEGCRTYLAIAGGWDVPDVLGSKSTLLMADFGGFEGRALKKGDLLKSCENLTGLTHKIFETLKHSGVNYTPWKIALQEFLPVNRKVIRVVPANELGWFSEKSITDFFSTGYVVGQQSNRMGYRLEGPVIERIKKDQLLSTAVTPGTIQVTGNGDMIILMADCQTTGGYPRIAWVAAVDLCLCAQLRPGDTIYFKEVSWREAEMLYLKRKRQLQALTTAVLTKFI